MFPFGPGKLAPPVGLLLGGGRLDILAQRALIAFKGEDMIFSPESSVNDPRPRLDPEEHETYVKKLTENLTSKDRWTLIFARMQLIRLGRYKDESQSTRLRLRSSSRAAPL